MIGVSAVELSQNKKVGMVSATYVSQDSCPTDCALRGAGCYAESGNTGFQTHRLNKASKTAAMTVDQLAAEEAAGINKLSGRFPLRLHVVGDCTTDSVAQTVSAAAYNHRKKFGNSVWTYTHAWKNVSRDSWGHVSVLASCEHVSDAQLAISKGYAPAMVVSEHPADGKAYKQDGLTVIPCPQQTGKTESCETCKLCWNADTLLTGKRVITFAAHGVKAKSVKANLVQIAGSR